MFLNKLHWGVLACLAFSPQVVFGAAADATGKSGKRMVCRPDCQWLDSTAAPVATPAAMALRRTLAKSAADQAAAAAQPRRLDLSVEHLPHASQPSDPGAGQGATLDLWQAVSLAVQTYPSIRDAAARLDQQREAINVARAGYLPTIQTGLNTGRQGAYGSGQNLSLSASQMIYDFGKVANAVKGAEAGVRVQRFQLMSEVDEVARQSAQALIEVARYRALRDSARTLVESLQRLRQLARQRASEGASTQADLIQAQSRVEAAEASLLAIQTQLRQQKSKLRTMIGREVDEAAAEVPAARLQQAAQLIEPSLRMPVGAGQALRAAEERVHTRQLEARDQWVALQEQMGGLDERLRVLADRQKSIVDTQRLYREQYLSLGTRTLLDLLNAEQEIYQAQSDSVNARHDLWSAQVAFINATGRMHDVFQLESDSL